MARYWQGTASLHTTSRARSSSRRTKSDGGCARAQHGSRQADMFGPSVSGCRQEWMPRAIQFMVASRLHATTTFCTALSWKSWMFPKDLHQHRPHCTCGTAFRRTQRCMVVVSCGGQCCHRTPGMHSLQGKHSVDAGCLKCCMHWFLSDAQACAPPATNSG